MGCEQSSARKIAMEPTRWSSRVLPEKVQIDPSVEGRKEHNNSYQDMINGQVHNNHDDHHVHMNGNGILSKLPLKENNKAMDETAQLLESYQRKEEEIVEIEKTEPLAMFYIKKSHLESITTKIEQMENQSLQWRNEVESSTGNASTTVASLLEKFGDQKLTKEDQDLLAKTSRLEIALTELEMAYQERALVENQVRNLHSTLLTLREAYRQLDDLLEQLSLNEETAEESTIQAELANIEGRRMNISEIYERWKEGRSQVGEACRQFSIALSKWRSLSHSDRNHDSGSQSTNTRSPSGTTLMMGEYDKGEDIRDDLVNAIQCLTNAKFYINLELPYCLPDEISVLHKALTYLFIDIRSEDRRNHAELCYGAIHKRAVALFAWIDKTIEFVIEPDLKELTRVINDKVNQLKRIRVEEIKKKYPGVDFQGNSKPETGHSSGVLSDLDGHDYSSLDDETEKVLNELQFDQLAPLPSIGEISVAHSKTEDMIEAFRVKLREEFAKELKEKEEKNPDDIITHRRNTLSRKLLLIDDSFR